MSSKTAFTDLLRLPVDALHYIINFASFSQLHVLRFVCKQTHSIAYNSAKARGLAFSREKILPKTSREGHLEVIKWVVETGLTELSVRSPRKTQDKILHSAIKSGNIKAVEWLCNCGNWDFMELDDYTFANTAGEHGHMEMLQWMIRENFATKVSQICFAAAEGGFFEIVKWGILNGFKPDNTFLSCACLGSNLDLIKYFVEEKNIPVSYDAVCNAALSNHFEVVKYLWNYGQNFSREEVLVSACSSGNLQMIKFLRDKGCPWKDTCFVKAVSEKMEILVFLKESGCPWNERVTDEAAKQSLYEVFKWAVLNGCPTSMLATTFFVEQGNFEMLNWCHENGTVIFSDELMIHNKKGGIEMMEWIKKNGYEHDKTTDTYIVPCFIQRGQLDVVKWLISNGYTLDSFIPFTYGDVNHEVVDWVFTKFNVSYTSRKWPLTEMVACKNLDLLKLLHKKGVHIPSSLLYTCVRQGNLETLKWLREIGCIWEPIVGPDRFDSDRMEVILWAIESGCPIGFILRVVDELHSMELTNLVLEKYNKFDKENFISNVVRDASPNYLNFLKSKGFPFTKKLASKAAGYGNISTIKKLVKLGCDWDPEDCIQNAEKMNYTRVIQWIEKTVM